MVDQVTLQRIDEFWRWFSANLPTVEHIRSGDHSSFDEVEQLLSRICEGMNFELSGSEGDLTLVISADGIRDRIPFVVATVNRAPELLGWRFIAFRQRNDANFELIFKDIKINVGEIWFKLYPQELYCSPLVCSCS